MNSTQQICYDAQAPSEVLVCVLAADGRGEFFSPSWLAFADHAQESCQGDGWLADVHVDHRAQVAVAIESAIQSGKGFRQRFRLRGKDGDYVWHLFDGIVRLGTHGAAVGLIGVCSDITRQVREDAETELYGRHFVDLLPHSEMLALALDNRGRSLFFNKALSDVLGCPAAQLIEEQVLARFLDHRHGSLAATVFPQGMPVVTVPAPFESEYIEGRDGRHVFSWHAIPLRDYAGQPSGLILIAENITERRLAEERLHLTSCVFESTDLAMIVTNARGTILSANQAFCRLTGYSVEEAVGGNPRMLQSGRHDANFYGAMWQTILDTGKWSGEIWDRRKDGSVYPKFLSINALRNEAGVLTHYSGVFYDISERKAIEEKLDHLAHFDALTELPNRLFLLDKLRQACHATASGRQSFAVLFLDLDHFKQVNDTLGHDAGDDLLRKTAQRLREAIRSHDVAARIGGDEFTVLLNDIKDEENAARVAQKIIDAFCTPLVIGGEQLLVTTSIGIALCPEHAGDPETLLRLADQAMYCAKAAGRNSYRFHKKEQASPGKPCPP